MSATYEQVRGYLARIGLDKAGEADLETVDALRHAHRRVIPFENLDIGLGRGIPLATDVLFEKLTSGRRGGYCFEQNAVFLAVLRTLGFEARPLLGRVWLLAEDVPPRTHTLNLVRLAGRDHIVDVGFGGSDMPILPLEDHASAATADGVQHRLVRDPQHGWMLERDGGSGWVRQYSFTTEAVWPVDLEAANHWTATRPDTRFTSLRIASMPLEDGYVTLVDRTLTISRRGQAEARQIETTEEYRRVLAERFGLTLRLEEVLALGLF